MVLGVLIAADIAIVSQLAFILSRANSSLVQKIRGIMCLPPLEPVTPPDSSRLRALSYSTWNTSVATDARQTLRTHATSASGAKVQAAKKKSEERKHEHHHHHHHRGEAWNTFHEPSQETIDLAGGKRNRSAILAARLERRAKAEQQRERDVIEGRVQDDVCVTEDDILDIEGTPLYAIKSPTKSRHHHHHVSRHPQHQDSCATDLHTPDPKSTAHNEHHHDEPSRHDGSDHHHHHHHHHRHSPRGVLPRLAQGASFLLTRDAFSLDSDTADEVLRNIVLARQGSSLGEPLITASGFLVTDREAETDAAEKGAASERTLDNEAAQGAAESRGEDVVEDPKIVVDTAPREEKVEKDPEIVVVEAPCKEEVGKDPKIVVVEAPCKEEVGKDSKIGAVEATRGKEVEEYPKIVLARGPWEEEIRKDSKIVVAEKKDGETSFSSMEKVQMESRNSNADALPTKEANTVKHTVPQIIIAHPSLVEDLGGVQNSATPQESKSHALTTMVTTVPTVVPTMVRTMTPEPEAAKLPPSNFLFRVHSDDSMPVLSPDDHSGSLEDAYDFPKDLNVDPRVSSKSQNKLDIVDRAAKKSTTSVQTIFAASEMTCSMPISATTGFDREFYVELRERAEQSLEQIKANVTVRQNQLAAFVENVSTIGILDNGQIEDMREELDAMARELDAEKMREEAFYTKAAAFFQNRHWT